MNGGGSVNGDGGEDMGVNVNRGVEVGVGVDVNVNEDVEAGEGYGFNFSASNSLVRVKERRQDITEGVRVDVGGRIEEPIFPVRVKTSKDAAQRSTVECEFIDNPKLGVFGIGVLCVAEAIKIFIPFKISKLIW